MLSKRQMVGFAAGLSLLGCTALLGCAASAASRPVPTTAASGISADDDLIADMNDRHRYHARGGVTMFIALSLDTLGLPLERQAAVTKIQSDLFTIMEPARVDEQRVLTTLADGVAAGAIDKLRVDAAVAQLASTSGSVHEASVDALNRLHAVLTTSERTALVNRVWAHWAIFQDADGLPELAKSIGLTAAQVVTIGRILEDTVRVEPVTLDPSEIDEHLKRLGAFREDAFDARTLAGGAAANAHLAARGARRTAHLYEVVSPVLTPDQRAKIVILLREHAGRQDVTTLAAAGH